MKPLYTIILFLFVSLNMLSAQDTLYVYKAGALIYKTDVATVDSMGFAHINYPPVANSDNAVTTKNLTIKISVLANDTDPEGDALSILWISNPTEGTVVLNSDGTVNYTPFPEFVGNDSFTYCVTDGDGGLTNGTVNVTVQNYGSYTNITPRLYYIIGLGDGTWTNSTLGLGKSLIPMSIVPGDKYNSTGDGEFTYTGYFKASRPFLLIRDIGSYSERWGMTGNEYTHNSGNNIAVPTDGYYTITLNSISNTLSIVSNTIVPVDYTSVGLIGNFTGWVSDILLKPVETNHNHVWYTTYTFSVITDISIPNGAKFRANGDWSFNWGDVTFPYGIGTLNGGNISFIAGTYNIIFNDIDGTYYFIKV